MQAIPFWETSATSVFSRNRESFSQSRGTLKERRGSFQPSDARYLLNNKSFVFSIFRRPSPQLGEVTCRAANDRGGKGRKRGRVQLPYLPKEEDII